MNPPPKFSASLFHSIDDTAADWLSRRDFGFTPGEQAEFSQWLLADPRHAAAVKQLDSAWRRLQKPLHAGQADAVERAIDARLRTQVRSRHRRQVAIFSLAGLAAAAVALVFVLRPAPIPETPIAAVPNLGSVELKPERQTLADGSVVELNAGAEIAANFTPEQRNVRLVRGEAHFEVAKNALRPFIVTAGAVSVRAVGTQFAVRFDPAAVDVLVTEGRVAVERQVPRLPDAMLVPAPEPTYLGVGNRLTVPSAEPPTANLVVQTVPLAEVKASLAWRNMRVEFTNTPLTEVVSLFNRQNGLQLSLGEPALEQIRISGVFWANDPEGFSRLIEASAGLKAVRVSDGYIVIHQH